MEDRIQTQAVRLMAFSAELARERTEQLDAALAEVAALKRERESLLVGMAGKTRHIKALESARDQLITENYELRKARGLPSVYGSHRVELTIGQQVLIVDADHTEDCTCVHQVFTLNGTEITAMFDTMAMREMIEDATAKAIDQDDKEMGE